MIGARWALLFCLPVVGGCHVVFPDVDLLTRPARVAESDRTGEVIGGLAHPAGPEAIILPVAAQEKKPKVPKTLVERLKLPVVVPGAQAPDIEWPTDRDKKKIEAALKKYFPPLPPLPDAPRAEKGPLSLAELESMARSHSPALRQAAWDIEAAQGNAVQAGLRPNPIVGYEGDTIGEDRTAGIHGAFIEQTFKTAGKLKLARAAALMEVRVAEAKYRQAEVDLLAQVRSGYFSVLAAKQNLEVYRALALFTEEVYQVLLERTQLGLAAPYEAMQVRVLAWQARSQVWQMQQRYVTAWRQLTTSMGVAHLPLTELTGALDRALPEFTWEKTLAQVLSRHAEVQAALAAVDKARWQLDLARVQPVPDIDLRAFVGHNATSQPPRVTPGVSVGVTLPIFDRNQGAIRQASAQLHRAVDEQDRLRNSLTAKLADAFERYENQRQMVKLYARQMVDNQAQAFRGALARHAADDKDGTSYIDLVNTEQTLVMAIGNYLNALRDQWIAVVDIAGLVQDGEL